MRVGRGPLSQPSNDLSKLIQMKSQKGDLVLRDVPGKGQGVFATRDFKAGDDVLQFEGDVRHVSAFDDLTYALQVGPEDFMAASGKIDDYVNHSCDPNTGVRAIAGRIELFALRDIAQGEEISFDYATTQGGGFSTLMCCCQSPQCRRVVGDFADLPYPIQRSYIERGAVLPYLIEADFTPSRKAIPKTASRT